MAGTQMIGNMTDNWSQGGTTFDAIKMNVTDAASASDSKLIDLQVGGSSRFSVDKHGHLIAIGDATFGDDLSVTGDAVVGGALSAGSLTLTTDLAITQGGTGASTSSAARANLGLAIGSDIMPWDNELAILATAGFAAADRFPYYTSASAGALATLTAFARNILDDPDASSVRTTIGALAAASYTAADVLAKLLTVDTDTSGLNADTVDGWQATGLLAFANHTGTVSAAQSALRPDTQTGIGAYCSAVYNLSRTTVYTVGTPVAGTQLDDPAALGQQPWQIGTWFCQGFVGYNGTDVIHLWRRGG